VGTLNSNPGHQARLNRSPQSDVLSVEIDGREAMRRVLIALLALATVATACAAEEDPTAGETAGTTETSTTAGPAASGATVAVTSSELGDILTDGDANTLYLFTPDAQSESVCYDQCEEAWPPLVGDVSAGDGADGSLLGTTERTDGSMQATYNGWPLYYFAADTAPGDINGQGVNDVWYVLDANGDGIGPSTSVEIIVTETDLGSILTDSDGKTLYLFEPDARGESACYDQCEDAWPPLTVDATAGDGVDEALLGTAPRTDGSNQVTYNGWPLYYFAADNAPGDINGQGVNDVWWVVDAAGDAIR
jgi:predicted lipoprotein with Yx(FWY)xxD motif